MEIKPYGESVIDMYNEGYNLKKQQDKVKEESKKFTLRGGSAGCLLEDGTVLGKSPHETLARFMGYQLETDPTTVEIFEGGFNNEEDWNRYLTYAGKEFLCEEKFPLTYEIGDYYCTGRPDCVIGKNKDNKFQPLLGIEHKVVASEGAAAKVYLEKKPKDENFIQACHYMYKFNLSYALVYTSYTIQIAGYFTKRDFGIEKIPPFKQEFKLGLKDKTFYYIGDDGKPKKTLVTPEGIDNFYRAIIEMYETKDITWLSSALHDIHGDMMYYNPNHYSDLLNLAPITKDFDLWEKRLQLAVSQDLRIRFSNRKGKQAYTVSCIKRSISPQVFDSLHKAREFIFKDNLV